MQKRCRLQAEALNPKRFLNAGLPAKETPAEGRQNVEYPSVSPLLHVEECFLFTTNLTVFFFLQSLCFLPVFTLNNDKESKGE